MDHSQTITHVSLCAGYGGIDLGLKRAIAGLRTIAFSEIEAFACANLVAKMEAGLLDPAPIWTDLKTFPWHWFCGKVDILSGGYPCQPFSAAGKRLGAEDPRHLWPHIANGISICRPALCFFENVEGHITLGLRDVLQDLGGLGYRTTWGIFSAAEVGAPHQRKRVFILAESSGERSAARIPGQVAWQEGNAGVADDCGYQAWPSRPGEQQHGWEPPRVVGDACGLHRQWRQPWPGRRIRSKVDAARRHEEEQRQTQPPLGRDADGPAGGMGYAELCASCDNRTDELRLLGNGVVPATAERAFRTLFARLTP